MQTGYQKYGGPAINGMHLRGSADREVRTGSSHLAVIGQTSGLEDCLETLGFGAWPIWQTCMTNTVISPYKIMFCSYI